MLAGLQQENPELSKADIEREIDKRWQMMMDKRKYFARMKDDEGPNMPNTRKPPDHTSTPRTDHDEETVSLDDVKLKWHLNLPPDGERILSRILQSYIKKSDLEKAHKLMKKNTLKRAKSPYLYFCEDMWFKLLQEK